MSESHDFGWALTQLRQGNLVRRQGWNGKGMFLYLVPSANFTFTPSPQLLLATIEKTEPFIVMFTAQSNWVPWLCSQADALATDWELA